jgi:hypothetical protein
VTKIEFFILILFAALYLFNWYVFCKIDDFKFDIYRVKSRLDTIDSVQNEIIKTLEKDLQSDDLNNGAEAND